MNTLQAKMSRNGGLASEASMLGAAQRLTLELHSIPYPEQLVDRLASRSFFNPARTEKDRRRKAEKVLTSKPYRDWLNDQLKGV